MAYILRKQIASVRLSYITLIIFMVTSFFGIHNSYGYIIIWWILTYYVNRFKLVFNYFWKWNVELKINIVYWQYRVTLKLLILRFASKVSRSRKQTSWLFVDEACVCFVMFHQLSGATTFPRSNFNTPKLIFRYGNFPNVTISSGFIYRECFVLILLRKLFSLRIKTHRK